MESDEKTGKWENQRLEELKDGDYVVTPGGDISNQEMPPWFESEKFDRAKQVFREHFGGINFSHLCGLILTFYFTKTVKTLKSTKESKNKTAIFHRYLQTTRHIQKWYEGNVFDVNDAAHRSLSLVRSMHAHAAKKMAELNDGVVYVSQWDMAVTQWAFIGPMVLFKSRVGLHYLDDKDYDALIHFWRSIGFLLGIEDQYNLCHGNYSQVVAACKAMLQKEYKVQVVAASPITVGYAKEVVSSLRLILDFLTWNSLSTYVHELVDISSPETMGYWDLICYYANGFIILFLIKSTIFRQLYNDFIRWRLDLADKKDLKMQAGLSKASGG